MKESKNIVLLSPTETLKFTSNLTLVLDSSRIISISKFKSLESLQHAMGDDSTSV